MSDLKALRVALLQLVDDDFGPYPLCLEQRFPHILQRMVALWGKPEIHAYLQGLLMPRGQGQSGFPRAALVEILNFRSYYRRKLPAENPLHDREALLRDTFIRFFDYDLSGYPAALEAGFMPVLEGIAALLDQPELDAHLDLLLLPASQAKHGFSEQAMLDLMMIKLTHRHRQISPPALADAQAPEDDHHDLHASLVLDRMYHR